MSEHAILATWLATVSGSAVEPSKTSTATGQPSAVHSRPKTICSVPFFVGAVGGHIAMNENLTMLSVMGFVALSGIVVNDSLVMVDFINRERQQGGSLLAAVQEAGVARLRPILLTSIATFAGLAPLLLEQGTQAGADCAGWRAHGDAPTRAESHHCRNTRRCGISPQTAPCPANMRLMNGRSHLGVLRPVMYVALCNTRRTAGIS